MIDWMRIAWAGALSALATFLEKRAERHRTRVRHAPRVGLQLHDMTTSRRGRLVLEVRR